MDVGTHLGDGREWNGRRAGWGRTPTHTDAGARLADCTEGHVHRRAFGALMTATFLGQFMSPILAQPVVRNLGFSAVYAFAASLTAVVAAAVMRVSPSTPQP